MTDPSPFTARFDSLRAGEPRRGVRFTGLEAVLRATTSAEVPQLLERVARAAKDGLHAAGYLSYEAASGFGSELTVHQPAPDAPALAAFGIFRQRRAVGPPEEIPGEAWQLGDWTASSPRERYRRAVADIRERIAAGETYQVNHTLHLRAPFAGCTETMYAQLCRAQGAAHCALLGLERHSIVSASPELFFRWAGGRLELRPMKGTRPRGQWREQDEALAAELLSSPKERAENLMIVDLLRNDAGRVAEWGSVRVSRLCQLESFPTVHQLTSSIEATTRPDTTLVELFAALFPCGSVTGAPKIQTMKVINEMEQAPRGIYTGAIGFVSAGEANFSVAIRTLLVDHETQTAEMGVGSGITWDSSADAEYDECLDKAAFARPAPDFELLETMLAEDGEVFLIEEHLERLLRSAELWGFAASATEIRTSLREAGRKSRGAGPIRLRLRLNRSGTVCIEVHSISPDQTASTPLRVAIAAEYVDSHDVMLYHKTTNRRMYDRRRAARPDCDDVLLLNERGEVTEATLANVVIRRGKELWTPPVSAGLLPGTYRARLLREGLLRERTIFPAELGDADGVYLINSVHRQRTATLVP